MKTIRILTGIVFIAIAVAGCKSDGESTEMTYEELIAQGWSAFAGGNYQGALNSFNEAKAMNGGDAGAYTGSGWSHLKLYNLPAGASEFSAGSTKSNVTADLYGGWAFGLNAQKIHSDSNTKADQALGMNPNWSFSHGLTLSANDLHVLKAENFYMLGNFQASLAEVQIVNPAFQANVTTSEGQAALAAEIERLR